MKSSNSCLAFATILFCKAWTFPNPRYFRDINNYIDILIASLLVVHIFEDSVFESQESIHLKLFRGCVVFLLMIRTLVYLSVFKTFRTLTGIISKVCLRIVPFMVITGFFYLTSLLLFAIMNQSVSLGDLFTFMYIWLIHGGIDQDTFQEQMNYVSVMFGTLLVTIVLMNIMIAYLSNEYSRLEEKQHLDDFRNKAKINLKVELVIRYARLLLDSGFRRTKMFRKFEYLNMIRRLMGYSLSPQQVAREVGRG